MNNNTFLAIVLSFGILVGYQQFYLKPHQKALHQEYIAQQEAKKLAPQTAPVLESAMKNRDDLIKADPRVIIETPELSGSINLKGARLDDLSLINYKEGLENGSPSIILLSPSGSAKPHHAYFAEFSWLSESISIPTPNSETVWKADGTKLTPDHSVRLSWKNGAGLTFERTIAVDAHAMFTVTDRVVNDNDAPVALYPFGMVARQGAPSLDRSVVHEGGLGVLAGTLEEHKYSGLIDDKKVAKESTGGWLGITDKYWLMAMIPPQSEKIAASFTYNRNGAIEEADGFFQTDYRGAQMMVPAKGSIERVSHLFAGAKRVRLLDDYAYQYDIPHFDRAIDFGWYYFLTRPFLYLLETLGHMVGSLGLAILIFTVALKIVTLPLSLKSYHSMARMKTLQPEMARIQERFANDKVRQSQEMMDLYKREKVSPVSGCLPTLIQIPIFFALYKVLYVNIEMRHAPFYGWIHDMSMPDPTSVLTLFGLIPVDLPSMLQIGAWPILMGISMFLQQKLSPQPTDKAQARIFMWMPIIFTYMLAGMPAGLVVYWTWSNLLGIIQQWYIMRNDERRHKAA